MKIIYYIFKKHSRNHRPGPQMYLILLQNLNRIQTELFALQIYFICVGLNCQRRKEKTPDETWVLDPWLLFD